MSELHQEGRTPSGKMQQVGKNRGKMMQKRTREPTLLMSGVWSNELLVLLFGKDWLKTKG